MNSPVEDFRVATRKSERPTKRVKVGRMTDANTEDQVFAFQGSEETEAYTTDPGETTPGPGTLERTV